MSGPPLIVEKNDDSIMGQVIGLLEEHLELTVPEMAGLLGRPARQVRHAVMKLKCDRTTGGAPRIKRVYVVRWSYEQCKLQRVNRAVFALGDKKDAKKPPPIECRQKKANYRANRARRIVGHAASIFDLGDRIAQAIEHDRNRRSKNNAQTMQA